MGCVVMEIVLQDRLFLFAFGGQDAEYRDDEDALKNVYEARLGKQIWSEYWENGYRFKALVLLATFDHYDLQNLMVEEFESDHLAFGGDDEDEDEEDESYDTFEVQESGFLDTRSKMFTTLTKPDRAYRK